MLTQRKRAPPEGAGARSLLASPLEAAPQPPQALAVVLPQPPSDDGEGDPVAALLYLADLPPDKLLTVEEVLTLIPISISTWRRGVRTGRFPPGIRFSARSVFWRVDAIRALLQSP
jgi:prophage regulatory protein